MKIITEEAVIEFRTPVKSTTESILKEVRKTALLKSKIGTYGQTDRQTGGRTGRRDIQQLK